MDSAVRRLSSRTSSERTLRMTGSGRSLPVRRRLERVLSFPAATSECRMNCTARSRSGSVCEFADSHPVITDRHTYTYLTYLTPHAFPSPVYFFVKEPTTQHFLPTLAEPPSRILCLECYSPICTHQYYLANDNVHVLYISCIIFCYAVTQLTRVSLSSVQ